MPDRARNLLVVILAAAGAAVALAVALTADDLLDALTPGVIALLLAAAAGAESRNL